MAGPKYGEFQFPRSFGFTGSADAQAGMSNVRAHVRRPPQRFAEGGPVKADPPEQKKATPTPPVNPPKSGATDSNKKADKLSLAEIMGGKGRRMREQELGLKKGGRVKHKPKPKMMRGSAPPSFGTMPDNDVDDMPGMGSGMAMKRGGRAKRYAAGGKVSGNALTQRSNPTSQLDAESGGKTPLRPGFKRGGMKKALGGPVRASRGGKMKNC